MPEAEVERLAPHPDRHRAGDTLSARNRFPGVVTSVEVDGVMALVEIEAGPHRITAAITRDAVEELGLRAGRQGHGRRQGDLGDGGAVDEVRRRSPSPWRRSPPAAAAGRSRAPRDSR